MNRCEVDSILAGAIDMHVHAGPVPGPYRQDAVEIAQQQKEYGMGGVVFKDTGYLTAPIADMINSRLPDFTVYGSITLNNVHGGLNPEAVETAARFGSKVVWMPTQSSENSMSKYRELGYPMPSTGITLVDERGDLRPEMEPILRTIREHGMILATGHISPEETIAVVTRAREMGIEKIILTHPFQADVVESRTMTLEQVKDMVRLGAYVEHTFVFHLPTEFSVNPAVTADLIREIGPEHTIISTDLGLFTHNPTPAEGMWLCVSSLLQQKIPAEDIRRMCRDNPVRLLEA